MKPFDQLTYQGRARRLRQLALAALVHYDLDVARVSLIQAWFNAIYRVDTTGGQKYVIRVCRPGNRTTDEIQAEALWLAALRRDLALNVPEPLLNRAGDLVTEATHPGVPEARRCVVFSWIPGPDLAQHITPDNMLKHGALTARLHQHAADFSLPCGLQVKCFDSVFPYNEPIALFEGPHAETLTADTRAHARTIAERSQINLDRLLSNGHTPRLIHADLHQWNLKVYRGALYALDFDDAMLGFPVQDIGIMLYYIHRRDDYPALYGAFRRGYESILPWPEQHRAEIETWIAWRAMDLLNWVIQSDPEEDNAFRRVLVDTLARFTEILRAYD
jgi:Ser/Thr protein kinase RdoA (MazF antagonist)